MNIKKVFALIVPILMLISVASFSGCTEQEIQEPNQNDIPELEQILIDLEEESNEWGMTIGTATATTANIMQLIAKLIIWFFETYMGVDI